MKCKVTSWVSDPDIISPSSTHAQQGNHTLLDQNRVLYQLLSLSPQSSTRLASLAFLFGYSTPAHLTCPPAKMPPALTRAEGNYLGREAISWTEGMRICSRVCTVHADRADMRRESYLWMLLMRMEQERGDCRVRIAANVLKCLPSLTVKSMCFAMT